MALDEPRTVAGAEPESEPIAFLTREPPTGKRWIDALSAAMPEERVVPFARLSADQHRHVRVAIVADPDPGELSALPALEWVQSTWAGVERLVGEVPDRIGLVRMVDPQLADTMAEAVLAAVLWLHRDGPLYAARQRARIWQAAAPVRASERVVGVLGLGALGCTAARRLAANGFPTLGWSRTSRPVSGAETIEVLHEESGLSALLSRADILVVLLPLTLGTRGLLDEDALGLLKPGAAIVNFARGPIIDEAALIEALDDGLIRHALLDVFDHEPLPQDHGFWSHERVTVWPHVSAPTDTRSASALIARHIARWRRTGETPSFVDRARGY